MVVGDNLKNQFLAGAASINITPVLGTIINGDFISHKAAKINDELYAKAVFLQKKDKIACMVIVDNCGLPYDFIVRTKLKIKNKIGIDPSAVLIAPTHAHSCGSVLDAFLSGKDHNYAEVLLNKIVAVVQMARANMVEARVAFDKVNVPEHIICRRYKMKEGIRPFKPFDDIPDKVITNPVGLEKWIDRAEGIVDTELSFIAIQSLTGQWISILANYSLHYVGDFDKNIISADYFGMFAKRLSDKINTPGFVGIMSNGTSANANIWDFLQPARYPSEPFEQSRLIAQDLAEKIVAQIPKLQWIKDPDLSIIYEDLFIKIRRPAKEHIEEAKALVKNVDFETIDHVNKNLLEKIYAREILLLANEDEFCQFPVQIIKIGNGIIGGLPGEVFGATGIELKNAADPLNYFSITMANAYAGYIVPVNEMEAGGYETWLCRSSRLPAEAEIVLKKTMYNFFERLK